ncbi:ash family protein [Enterobacter hormaechei]
MVTRAGLPKGGPVSVYAGNANPVQVTTSNSRSVPSVKVFSYTENMC